MSRVFAALALSFGLGCSVFACSSISTPTTMPSAQVSSIANGRSIFQTGKDLSGAQIVANPAPLHDSCEACHGVDGSGGKRLPGGAISADLRYSALVQRQRHPYTLASLERAISTGVDNQGQPLNPVMPRWRLSKRDLHDVARYVFYGLDRTRTR